jgi:hypothetical protein
LRDGGSKVNANFNELYTAMGGDTLTKPAQWDTAYGWGNHASAGYLTSIALGSVGGVSLSSPSNGQVLKFNGTNWVNATDETGGAGATNLGYTAATRVLTSDTGTDVTLPLVSSGDAGLAPASGGGTTNFLRADGTWQAPAGGGTVTSVGMTVPTGLSVSGSPVTGSGTLAVTLAGGYVIPTQAALDAKLDADIATDITATKGTPIGADQIILLDSADSDTPKLATITSLPAGTPADGSITDAKISNRTALSVFGRSANSSGVGADLAAGTDGHVLRRSGTSLGFGTVATAGVADAAITLAKMANLAQDQFIGRTTASTGVPQTATITAAARTVLDDTTTAAMLTTLGGQPLDSDLTTIASLTATTDNFIQAKSSAWASRTVAQVAADLNGTGLVATNLAYRHIPQNSQSAAYTCVAADAGGHILHPTADNNARTFTIPANSSVAYPIGAAITFVNLINTVTIAITTDTLILAGAGTTGSRTLAANGVATAIKITSTSWIISGTGLT